MKKILFICLISTLSVGCAIGNKYGYNNKVLNIPVNTDIQTPLVLAIDDKRPYIISGDKPKNFVGLQRGGFGNPFSVTTTSGNSLADDFLDAISSALRSSGYKVTQSSQVQSTALIEAAKSNGASRIVMITINEWKSDVFVNIKVIGDLELVVWDTNGNKLASNSVDFSRSLGGAAIGAQKNSNRVLKEFEAQIAILFNKKEIRDSLL